MQHDGRVALVLGVKQQMAVTNDVIQSLEILRMPAFELSELLTQRLYENPLLEIATDNDSSEGDFSPISIENAITETDYENTDGVYADDFQFDISYIESPYRTFTNEEYLDFSNLCSQKQSFFDMLIEEINALPLNEYDTLLCRRLVACLNRWGYFEDDTKTLAVKCECNVLDIERAIGVIQGLQPAGVGARSLQECLLLQLRKDKNFEPLAMKLVESGLTLLAANDTASIASLLNASGEEARRISEIVRNLNPIPSQGSYTGEDDMTVVPEAIIRYERGAYSIAMNEQTVPRLIINEDYDAMLQRMDSETESYIKRMKSEAKWLIRAVEEREKTILRILRQVVSEQHQYFKNGTPLTPMKMTDIAKELEMNVSTVSRAIQGKYIVCAAGTVPLKSLFAAAAAQNARGENLSADYIKQKLRTCIENEDSCYPLSDEALQKALRAVNINIARRTVAKYRMAMNIPSVSMRRR